MPLDILRYLVPCVLLLLAGRAVLHLLRDPVGRDAAWLLGPCIALAVHAVILGPLVPSGFVSVKLLTVPIWLITGAAATYGGWIWWRVDLRAGWLRDVGVYVALVLILPVIAMLPAFANGLADYAGSGLQDKFAYVAQGQYLWHFGFRDVTPDLGPLYRFGSTFNQTRYISASELGVLSPLTIRGDTQASANLLQAIGLCAFGGACVAFGLVRRLPRWALIAYVVVTVVSGWCLNVVWANNYDNLLVLGWFPAFGAIASMAGGGWSASETTLWVLLGGAYVYTFPESSLLAIGAATILLAPRLWSSRAATWWRTIAILIAGPFVVGAPYLLGRAWYLKWQMGKTLVARGVGAGMFEGLADGWLRVAAFWALGAEHRQIAWFTAQNVAAACLDFACLAGIVALLRQRGSRALLLVVGLLWLAAALWGLYFGFGYVTYKFVLLCYWLTTFVAVSGVAYLISQRVPGRAVPIAVAVCGLAAVPIHALVRVADEYAHPRPSMSRYSQIQGAVTGLADEPIGVFLDDLDANLWAMFYLRRHPVQYATFLGYPADPKNAPILHGAPHWPWKQIRYVLTDSVDRGPLIEEEGWTRVWGTSALTIWDTGTQGWAIAAGLDNPNGRDPLPMPFLWLGGGTTQVNVIASRAGELVLTAEFLPGPSGPSSPLTRHVRVTAPPTLDAVWTLEPGIHSLRLPVGEGENAWTLTPLDRIAVSRLPNGDPRTLLVGLRNPTVAWEAR